MVDLRPGGEEAGLSVEVAIVASEAVCEGEGQHGVEVALGRDALVADALVGECAFGVEAGEGVRGVRQVGVGQMDELAGEGRMALGVDGGGERGRDEGVGLCAGWLGRGVGGWGE